MDAFKKLLVISIVCGIVIGAFLHIYPGIVIDSIKPLFFGILLVPIVFLFNKYLEFNDYLRLLTKEIKDNLDLIEKLPESLQNVRNGDRAWLPGIASNRPTPGYSIKYISLNIYDNFINQKYWLYLNMGAAGRLAELYHYFRVYCDVVQTLQTQPGLLRDPDTEKPIDPEYYSDTIYRTSLARTVSKIHQHASNLNLNDYNSFIDKEWWCPNWLKE
jgi:hypothetical protein